MKKKLLRLAKMCSYYSFIGLLAQLVLYNCLFASDLSAQEVKSIDEVYVSVDFNNAKIDEAFHTIEAKTNYRFAYERKDLDSKVRLNLESRNSTLKDVLLEISKEASLKFRQINYDIDVQKIKRAENIEDKERIDVYQGGITVSGNVTSSEDNSGIPGVNVVLKGTTTGSVTDMDGNYVIEVPEENSVLVFSSIGFVTQEIEVNGRSTIDLTLNPDVTELSEIVVVGYGTQDKKEITSAVASVTPEEFNKGNITDVAQLLQGKVAGLSITRAGGDPNGGYNIRLRGLSTLGANTQPLVVIDGQAGADLNSVDPNDIESIDILKDGSAAAIYGTRGSAGVILVTTKAGSKRGTNIDYNGYLTIESAARTTPTMSAEEFRSVAPSNRDFGENTDWYDEISRTSVSHTHNLSISGGNESGTSFRASANYRDLQGLAINSDLHRLNARLNLQQRAFNDKLKIDLNIATTNENSDLGWNEAFKYAAIFNPTAPVKTDDPVYDLAGGGYFEENFVDYANPVAMLEQNDNTREIKRMNFMGALEYEFIPGLLGTIRYSQQSETTLRSIYMPKDAYYSTAIDDNPVSRTFSGFTTSGYSRKKNDESFNQLLEIFGSYDTDIADVLNFKLLGGYSWQEFEYFGFLAGGSGFLTDLSADDLNAAAAVRAGSADVDSYKNGSILIAFFGRLNLNYDNTFFLSASLRREGSTQFGEGNKWGNFPAVSLGIDLARLGNLNATTFNTLKLRASYGVTGALPPQSYLSLSTLAPGESSFYAGDLGYINAYEPQRNPNPDLKWETKTEIDIGLDISLFEGRLNGTIDYYNRNTEDLIYEATVPVPPNLNNTTWLNVGTMKSNGLEFTFNYDVFSALEFTSSNFSWNTGINFSTYNIEFEALNAEEGVTFDIPPANLGTPGQEQTQIARVIPGEDLGILWGLTFVEIDEDGKYVFEDLNDDGAIDTEDEGPVGNGLPSFEFGWTNSFTFGNFDLNFFIRGAIGHDLVNTYRAFYENATLATTYNVVKTKYYDPNLNDAQIFSDLHVEKASFVEMDNLTVGYNFQLPSSSSFRTLRLYLTAQNLFMITDYTGVDPEVRYADVQAPDDPDPKLAERGILTPGIDRRNTWVLPRSFTLGLNVGF